MLWECFRMLENASKCFRTLQIALKCFRSLQNGSKCFQMLPDASRCFRMLQNAPECFFPCFYRTERFRGLRSVWGLGFFYLKHNSSPVCQTKRNTLFCDYVHSSATTWSATSSGGALAIAPMNSLLHIFGFPLPRVEPSQYACWGSGVLNKKNPNPKPTSNPWTFVWLKRGKRWIGCLISQLRI